MKTRVAERTYIDLEAAGRPAWAMGCGKCRCGLIDPPDVAVADTSLYLIRTYQAANGRGTSKVDRSLAAVDAVRQMMSQQEVH